MNNFEEISDLIVQENKNSGNLDSNRTYVEEPTTGKKMYQLPKNQKMTVNSARKNFD